METIDRDCYSLQQDYPGRKCSSHSKAIVAACFGATSSQQQVTSGLSKHRISRNGPRLPACKKQSWHLLSTAGGVGCSRFWCIQVPFGLHRGGLQAEHASLHQSVGRKSVPLYHRKSWKLLRLPSRRCSVPHIGSDLAVVLGPLERVLARSPPQVRTPTQCTSWRAMTRLNPTQAWQLWRMPFLLHGSLWMKKQCGVQDTGAAAVWRLCLGRK